MNVPFVDFAPMHQPLEAEFQRVFQDILRTSHFVAGSRTEIFEKEWAKACGAKEAVFTNNGTTALTLALLALNLPKGGEVLIPVNTFIATVEAVALVGLEPVFIDIDPDTFLMDLAQVPKRLTKKTVALLPVHLYGQLVDIHALQELLIAHGRTDVKIIEDACQAHGARWWGRPRLVSDAAAYSFYPGKNLGALGEAGAVVLPSRRQASWLRKYRSHGSAVKYHHELLGTNARQSELQAGFLGVKLPHLTQFNAHRVQAALWYQEGLQGIRQVRYQPVVEGGRHVYHLFVVQVEKRRKLQAYLTKHGVQWGLHYPVPLHKTPALASLPCAQHSFPVAEETAKHILSLPLYYGISQEQVQYVCNTIRAFYQQ